MWWHCPPSTDPLPLPSEPIWADPYADDHETLEARLEAFVSPASQDDDPDEYASGEYASGEYDSREVYA